MEDGFNDLGEKYDDTDLNMEEKAFDKKKKESEPPKKGKLLCFFDSITKHLAMEVYQGKLPEEIKKEIDEYDKSGKLPLEADSLDEMRQKIGVAFEKYKQSHPVPSSPVTKCLEQIVDLLKKAPQEMFLCKNENGTKDYIKGKQNYCLLKNYQSFATATNKVSNVINNLGDLLKNKKQRFEGFCNGDKRKLKKVAKFFNACADFISTVKKDFEEALDTVVKKAANGEIVDEDEMCKISAFAIGGDVDKKQLLKLLSKTYPYLFKIFDTSLFDDMPELKKEYDEIIKECMRQIKGALPEKIFEELKEGMQALGMVSSSQVDKLVGNKKSLNANNNKKSTIKLLKTMNKSDEYSLIKNNNFISFDKGTETPKGEGEGEEENEFSSKEGPTMKVSLKDDEKFEPIEFIKDFSGIKFDIDKASQKDFDDLKQQLDSAVAALHLKLEDMQQPGGDQPGVDEGARKKLKEIIDFVNALNGEQKSYMQQQNQETSEIKQYIQQYEEMLQQSDQTINDLKKKVDEFKKNQNEEEEEEEKSESTLDSILSQMSSEEKKQEKEEKEKKEKEEEERKDKQRKENMMQMMKMMMKGGNNNMMAMMMPFIMQQYGSQNKGNKTMNNLMPLMFMMSQQQSR